MYTQKNKLKAQYFFLAVSRKTSNVMNTADFFFRNGNRLSLTVCGK